MIDVRYRQTWFDAVLADAELSPTVCRVAMALGFSMHIGSGDCYPSYDLLGKKAACSRDTAMRAVKTLEAGGWVRIARSKGRKSNAFTLTLPATLTAKVETVDAAFATVPDAPDATVDTLAPVSNGGTAMQPLALPQQSQADATVARMKQSQIEAATVAELCDPKRIEKIPPYNPPIAQPAKVNDAFETLCEIWSDDIGDRGRARTAFTRAVSVLNVDPDKIVAAARERRIQRLSSHGAAAEPLATWLRREGWAVPPKLAMARQSTGQTMSQVFVEEGSDAWRAWVAHRRHEGKTVPATAFSSKQGRRGWLFPSEYPPKVREAAYG